MSVVTDYLEKTPESEVALLRALTEEQQQALLEVLCLAVFADGYHDSDEHQLMAELIRDVPAFASMEPDELGGLLSAAAERVLTIEDEASATALLEDIAARLDTPNLREVAFGMAAIICLADGIVVDPERTVLSGLIGALGLSMDRVREILAEARLFVEG